jgi:hypothetical protein
MTNSEKRFSRSTASLLTKLGALRNHLWAIGIAVAFAILVIRPVSLVRGDSGSRQHYPQLADAFLHGRLDIDSPLYDTATYHGKTFVPFPPFPAVVLLPQVALLGRASTSGILAGIALTVLSLLVFVQILLLLNIRKPDIAWVTAAFLLGTGYWVALILGYTVYYFAHLVAVCCLFLSIWVSMRYGNGFLGGLFLGFAFLSRQFTILAGVWILVLLWSNSRNQALRDKLVRSATFAMGLGICVLIYLAYNWARFGNALETGYSMIEKTGFLQARVDKYGLFNIAYLPFNFAYMFVQGPSIQFGGPRNLVPVGMDPFGTSLTFASPFVLVALGARGGKSWLIGAWASIGLIVAGILLYYNNGWVQWNAQRYSLDFLPILIVLTALGMQQHRSWVWKLAVLFSVALNMLVVGLFLHLPK